MKMMPLGLARRAFGLFALLCAAGAPVWGQVSPASVQDERTSSTVQTGAAQVPMVEYEAVPMARQTDASSTPAANSHEEQTMPMDPFSYNLPGRSGGFLPFEMGTIPSGIEVLGILVPKNAYPMAVLFVPGHATPFYVSENDVIGVNVPQGVQRASSAPVPAARSVERQTASNSSPASSTNSAKKGRSRPTAVRPPVRIANQAQSGEEVLFIKIGKITDQQVELHPVTNPENVRILR